MTTNEALVKQNFITKVLLKDGDVSLTKELKVKVMNMRIKLGKIRKEFDSDVQEAIKDLTPEGFIELANKPNRTEEEEKEFQEKNNKLNEDYQAFVVERGKDIVDFEAKFTEDEYAQILEVNADNDIEINGQKLSAPDFLEAIYSLFVEEEA
jgi:hypothetical protein